MKNKYFYGIVTGVIALTIMVIIDHVCDEIGLPWMMTQINDVLYYNTDLSWFTCAATAMGITFVIYDIAVMCALWAVKDTAKDVKRSFRRKYSKRKVTNSKVNWMEVD